MAEGLRDRTPPSSAHRRRVMRQCVECGTPFLISTNYASPAHPGRYLTCSNECSRARKGRNQRAAKNPNWRGQAATYGAIHLWVGIHLVKTGRCSVCGREKRTEWANRDHLYRRVPGDWIEVCSLCHWRHDVAHGLRHQGSDGRFVPTERGQ